MAQPASLQLQFDRRQQLDNDTVLYRKLPVTAADASWELKQSREFANSKMKTSRVDRVRVLLSYKSAVDPLTLKTSLTSANIQMSFPETSTVAERDNFISLLAALLGDPSKRKELANVQLPGENNLTLSIDSSKVSTDEGQVS